MHIDIISFWSGALAVVGIEVIAVLLVVSILYN